MDEPRESVAGNRGGGGCQVVGAARGQVSDHGLDDGGGLVDEHMTLDERKRASAFCDLIESIAEVVQGISAAHRGMMGQA